MVSRIVALALLSAALVAGAGALAWWQHVLGIESLQQSRTAFAEAIYATGERRPEVLAREIAARGVHVIVEDHANFTVYDAGPDGVVTHHPGGALPPGPLPLVPPLVVGLPQPQRPPPGRAQPPLAPRPLDLVARQLANLPALRAGNDQIRTIVVAEAGELRTFLVRDVAVVAAALLLIATIATLFSNRLVLAERSRLVATAERRHALAGEYQRFLADAGHELRTPLTIVSGYVDILEAPLAHATPELARAFASMKTETARMRALVEKMLLLARLETPQSVPSLIDAGDVAEQSVEAMRARFPERDLEHERERQAPIVIDQDDLYEALHNLIENALKYAPHSAVRIKTTANEGHAVISVTDFGPGIALAEREAVFERFYRGEQRAEAEGSGLGLAIVRRVVDRWRGEIDLESRQARTVFTLQFPLADEERE